MKQIKGLLYGIIYGLIARGIFALEFGNSAIMPTEGLMTLSFIVFVPFVIGLVVTYFSESITSSYKVLPVVMPIYAIIGVIAITVALGIEGLICAVMALPIFLLMALLGGFAGVRIFRRTKNKTMISLFILLPFFISIAENQIGMKERIFSEHTSIIIHAGEEEVWEHITRVHEITEAENERGLFQWMGFPRPLKAELDTVAVGGIRKAIFAKGLFFTETVTKVEPNRLLAFNIEADPASIPPQALDEHVLVGGKYFDVLEGRYEIEKVDESNVMLHLSSKFRLSTNFNFYSGLWSKLIMRDIQDNILKIVKARSEQVQR